ncbi:hypothetical protein KL925_000606 [Ogataea polymorpha]|uniref:Uncharacterized protein n=1 Tax=Ogataea polymorpha TaxID=460523 RepID=A0A9P8P409_9ASCO|nr:hypothetical protein KL906_003026 [Ogataea polymorpha]KAG7920918.1 hypothetical protein KL927_000162 [Ogataea polymorpha]KAG7929864.1 hypothetical protein KL925_000606 [Ogataea polymorpha]KAH3664645.1 hypothetical protein OGATHE_003460 [Ogataea polymorpha]
MSEITPRRSSKVSEHETDAFGVMHNDVSSDSSAGLEPLIDHRRHSLATDLSKSQRQRKRGFSLSAPMVVSDRPKNRLSIGTATGHPISPSSKDRYGSVDEIGESKFRRFKSYNNALKQNKSISEGLQYKTENPFESTLRDQPAKGLLHDLAEHEPYNSNNDDESSNSVYGSSNPSSRRSSNASSLDDVCVPVESFDEAGKRKMWPDISVLQEFVDEELQEFKKISEASASLSRQSSPAQGEERINFEYPLVSNIEPSESEPLLVQNENEQEALNGRLRPRRVVPWSNNRKVLNEFPELRQPKSLRFTYFREDLENTIHASNISGLVQKYSLSELFSPSTQEHSSQSNVPHPNIASVQSSQNSLKPRVTGTSTPTPSVAADSSSAADVPPFWLDVLNPTEEEMKVLSKAFSIHPLTTEDIFMGETREKVELFRDYYLVCFTAFDVVLEHQNRKKALERAMNSAAFSDDESVNSKHRKKAWYRHIVNRLLKSKPSSSDIDHQRAPSMVSKRRDGDKRKKNGELEPLNMYIIVFRDGVITFHQKPTPHPANVRRRVRLLKDYLSVTSDWIGYALIDDITDAYAPLIESIEDEVNAIEDAILVMQSGIDSDEESSGSEDEDDDKIWLKLKRRTSTVNDKASINTWSSKSSRSTSSSQDTKILSWKRKGDMLRRIGDCRRRVMSLLRLLGFKADVIKGFSKRCNEQWEVAPRSEIGMYLGDIQDHIVTMVQSLNHYEKLLARSHSNYLAQINIDMTRVNNDMNDILGKITILGSIVLPLNVVTGLWGMNCLVPGQNSPGLTWFYSICGSMFVFAVTAYLYARKVSGIV